MSLVTFSGLFVLVQSVSLTQYSVVITRTQAVHCKEVTSSWRSNLYMCSTVAGILIFSMEEGTEHSL